MTTRRKISQLPGAGAIQTGDEVAIRRGNDNLKFDLGSAAGKTAAAPGAATSGQVPTVNSAGFIARGDGGTGEAFPSASNQYLGTNAAGQPGFHDLRGFALPVWSENAAYGLDAVVVENAEDHATIYRSLRPNNNAALSVSSSWQRLAVPPSRDPVGRDDISAADAGAYRALCINEDNDGLEWRLITYENLAAGTGGTGQVLTRLGTGIAWRDVKAISIGAGEITRDKIAGRAINAGKIDAAGSILSSHDSVLTAREVDGVDTLSWSSFFDPGNPRFDTNLSGLAHGSVYMGGAKYYSTSMFSDAENLPDRDLWFGRICNASQSQDSTYNYFGFLWRYDGYIYAAGYLVNNVGGSVHGTFYRRRRFSGLNIGDPATYTTFRGIAGLAVGDLAHYHIFGFNLTSVSFRGSTLTINQDLTFSARVGALFYAGKTIFHQGSVANNALLSNSDVETDETPEQFGVLTLGLGGQLSLPILNPLRNPYIGTNGTNSGRTLAFRINGTTYACRYDTDLKSLRNVSGSTLTNVTLHANE